MQKETTHLRFVSILVYLNYYNCQFILIPVKRILKHYNAVTLNPQFNDTNFF